MMSLMNYGHIGTGITYSKLNDAAITSKLANQIEKYYLNPEEKIEISFFDPNLESAYEIAKGRIKSKIPFSSDLLFLCGFLFDSNSFLQQIKLPLEVGHLILKNRYELLNINTFRSEIIKTLIPTFTPIKIEQKTNLVAFESFNNLYIKEKEPVKEKERC